jgi:hypothetical protein
MVSVIVCILGLAAQMQRTMDLPPGGLPAYARDSGRVESATPEPVDWDSPVPVIRTAEQYREAKSRAVPAIWFEGEMYFLTEGGKYAAGDRLSVPTPTPGSTGEVEFANGVGQTVEFRIYPVSPDLIESGSGTISVPAYSARKAALPVGAWRYAVAHPPASTSYPTQGVFSVGPEGATHILFGYPGRSVARARNQIRKEQAITVGNAGEQAEEVSSYEEMKISRILARIPRYPDALRMDMPNRHPNFVVFKTLDTEEKVRSFYDQALRGLGYGPVATDQADTVSYMKKDAKVSLEIFPTTAGKPACQFLLKVYPLD